MLIIVLESVGLDPAGLALILAVDRPLDMLRTAVNVTGDSTIAAVIASSEDEIKDDAELGKIKEIDTSQVETSQI